MMDNDQFVCELCQQYSVGGTDDGYCWDCVDAAEDITGKQLAERRVVWTADGGRAWWEDYEGNVLEEEDVLIEWPVEQILAIRERQINA